MVSLSAVQPFVGAADAPGAAAVGKLLLRAMTVVTRGSCAAVKACGPPQDWPMVATLEVSILPIERAARAGVFGDGPVEALGHGRGVHDDVGVAVGVLLICDGGDAAADDEEWDGAATDGDDEVAVRCEFAEEAGELDRGIAASAVGPEDDGELGGLAEVGRVVDGVGGQRGGLLARGWVGAGAGVGMEVPVGEAQGLFAGAVDGLDGEGDGVAAGAAVDGDLEPGGAVQELLAGCGAARLGEGAVAGCWARAGQQSSGEESEAEQDERRKGGLDREMIGHRFSPEEMNTMHLTASDSLWSPEMAGREFVEERGGAAEAGARLTAGPSTAFGAGRAKLRSG